MKCRNPEEVIDIVLLRVLAFYLVIILETGTSMLLLMRVKNTGSILRYFVNCLNGFWKSHIIESHIIPQNNTKSHKIILNIHSGRQFMFKQTSFSP